MHRELRDLGICGHQAKGGVECSGSVETLWSVHQFSRLAESVRLRLRPFEAHGFPELEQNLRRLPWHAYLRKDDPFTLSVTCQGSRLYHTEAISERVTRIIQTCLEGRAQTRADSPDEPNAHVLPPQKLHVRVHRNLVQVSVDASGGRLHRRGYRTHVGDAPLRETLAAALVQLLRQRAAERVVRLWDPCCGSGTILAEWLLARRDWAATRRSHAFERWPVHAGAAYDAWLATLEPSPPTHEALRAYGSDINPRSIDAAHHNLVLARLDSSCELFAQDFHDAASRIPMHTAVASNLPYGVRLTDTRSASRLFQSLDELLWERRDLRPAVLLLALVRLPQTRCAWEPIATFANGGLRVTAWSIR